MQPWVHCWMHCWMHCRMQPWVAIRRPWLALVPTWAALPLEGRNPVALAVQLVALALEVEVEVADKSVAWAVGALSAKVAQARVGVARVGVDRLSALVASQARVGVERHRAWWVERLRAWRPCILHWSSHPIRHHHQVHPLLWSSHPIRHSWLSHF